MEALKEFLEKKKASILINLKEDTARIKDPIVGQFMRGRSVIEEDYLATLDNILDYLKEKE